MNGLVRIGEEEGEYMLTTLKTIVTMKLRVKFSKKCRLMTRRLLES